MQKQCRFKTRRLPFFGLCRISVTKAPRPAFDLRENLLTIGFCYNASPSMANTHPHVHQINVSDGGVPKLPVPKAYITVQGVAGDRQRSVQYHGGADRGLCLYALEVIEALRA